MDWLSFLASISSATFPNLSTVFFVETIVWFALSSRELILCSLEDKSLLVWSAVVLKADTVAFRLAKSCFISLLFCSSRILFVLASVESTFVRTLETFGPISDAIALMAESWNFPPNVSPSFAILLS